MYIILRFEDVNASPGTSVSEQYRRARPHHLVVFLTPATPSIHALWILIIRYPHHVEHIQVCYSFAPTFSYEVNIVT